MPFRAPKMYGFIFGFQRLVWWPKWTPASSNWRMVMPCAGCMACCMPAGGDSEGAVVWTFSDIVFVSSTSVAPTTGPRGEPCPDREVCVVGAADLRTARTGPAADLPGRGGLSSRFATPAQLQGGAPQGPNFARRHGISPLRRRCLLDRAKGPR